MLILIFLAALISRLALGFFLGFTPGHDYSGIADNIVSIGSYSFDGIHPTAYRTPVYPLFLAMLKALSGNNISSFIIAASIIAALNACLCAHLAKQFFNRRAGLTAGLIYILTPYLAQKEVSTENGLVTLGLLATVCLFWKARQKHIPVPLPAAGLCLAFSYLTRPTTGLIPFFLGAVIIFDAGYEKIISRRLIAAGILILAFSAGILPWGIRNKIAFEKWYFGQTNFWYNFYIGNHPRTFEIYPRLSLDNLVRTTAINARGGDEFQQEDWFYRQSMDNLKKTGPINFALNCLRKLGLLWQAQLAPYTERIGNDPNTKQPLDKERNTLKNLSYSIPHAGILLLTAIACLRQGKRKKLFLFMFGFIFCFSVPYMLTFAYSRYVTPAYFILIIMASSYLPSLINWGSNHQDRSTA